MKTDPSTEHVAVTCSVDCASNLVDAASTLSVRVRVSSVPPCDFEGEEIQIRDETGAVMARGKLGPYDEDRAANLIDALLALAPAKTGDVCWSARLAAHAGGGIRYDEVICPVPFTVRAHQTSVVVWDVPQAVPAGETFRIKVGIKGSGQCSQAHRGFLVVDAEGKTVAASTASPAIWPKSAALHFTELELNAPETEGHLKWEARCEADCLGAEGAGVKIAHTAGSARFGFRCVAPPQVKVRIEAWDAARQVPLAGARVVLHPYGTVTDEDGVAEIRVARGQYRLFVTQKKYTTFGTEFEVADDLSARIELSHEPPPNRE